MKKDLAPACRGSPGLYPEYFCLGRREVAMLKREAYSLAGRGRGGGGAGKFENVVFPHPPLTK